MGGIAHEDLPVTPQRSRQGRAKARSRARGHPRAGLDGKIGVIGYKNTGQPPSSVLIRNKQKCALSRTKTAGRPTPTDPRMSSPYDWSTSTAACHRAQFTRTSSLNRDHDVMASMLANVGRITALQLL